MEDIPIRKRTKACMTGWYQLEKHVGIFIPSARLDDVQHILNENNFVETKNIIFTDSNGEWYYTLIHCNLSNVSLLLDIKKELDLPLMVETADTLNNLADLMSFNIL
jgi:DNA polymerase III sliding clamp (beta) subunit (PCNA family)